jgi:hypothetical protein
MSFGTGRSASKKARRDAKTLKKMGEFQERRQMLREFGVARSMVSAAGEASGTGSESSGRQAVAGSVSTQGRFNYQFARESGKVYNSMLGHQRRAKSKAGAFGTAVKVAAVAAAVYTAGASVAAAGAVEAGGAVAVGTVGSSTVAASGATIGAVGTGTAIGGSAGLGVVIPATGAVGISGGAAAGIGAGLKAGYGAFSNVTKVGNAIAGATAPSAVPSVARPSNTPLYSPVGGAGGAGGYRNYSQIPGSGSGAPNGSAGRPNTDSSAFHK